MPQSLATGFDLVSMNNLIIIQARLSSTRLSGKVLLPIWQGKNLLDLQVAKIRELGIPFVLATTSNPSDNLLVQWAQGNNVEVFRGDEQNVLRRFMDCAHAFGAKNLIRVCSDNPFIQLDQIPYYLERLAAGIDYISYCNEQGSPAIKTHWGLFLEGVSLTALVKAQESLNSHPKQAFYQEHVTNFIYGQSELFKVVLEKAPAMIANRKDLRFTIDTADDFQNMAELLKILNSTEKSLEELVKTTDNYPRILARMQNGIQSFNK